MELVIDSNIIFSALLRKKSHELKIIESGKYEIYQSTFTSVEIFKHKSKIIECSKLTEEEIIEQYTLLNKYLITVNEKIIPKEIYLKAYELCKEKDPDDTIFIALSLYLNAKFWSGDEKLLKHLYKKGFNNIIRTNNLFNSL